MGQYYKPVIIKEDKTIIAWACSWAYDNGAKLMEHSWIGNNLVAVIENLLLNNPNRIVWCGDYADTDADLGINEEAVADGYDGKMNLYDLCDYKGNALKEVKGGNENISKRAKYVINHTTKEFVDKTKAPSTGTHLSWNRTIHPLPLLTCKGNGRGGGDFGYADPQGLVGKWSGHEISIGTRKPRGFKEILFDLVEE